ncbi:acetate--CoA ligase family protein [Thermodesulfobacteriota bacterium]
MPTIQSIINKARVEGRVLLSEIESKELLADAGIRVVETRLATSREEAISIAEQLGLPAVLKIASTEITHKSDAGGVKVDLRTAAQVGEAYDDIITAVKKSFPGKEISGVAVQKMCLPGIEVIVGMSRDDQFGPMLMFGLGGILVELLKDVSFRIVPLTKRDAREMIREIKSYPVLAGYRGQPGADVSKLEDMLLKISAFLENDQEIQELDLNPVFAYADDAIAVDARVILREKLKSHD